MEQSGIIMSPEAWVRKHRPDEPVVFFDPQAVQRGAQAFAAGFPGVVSYAVKANPREEVLANLVAAGVRTFDVASPAEMAAVRALCPQCELHYNNPVRSPAEVAQAVRFGVVSASVDCLTELEKLAPLAGIEVAVRFRLPVAGAAYDFGAKFGASEAEAALLLAEVAQRGFLPSLCFHPGTQCPDPEAWADYIRAAGRIVRAANVTIARLNVGGGFSADRGQGTPDHPAVFARIAAETKAAFGPCAPQLLCEPGRALAAPAVTLALRVKALESLLVEKGYVDPKALDVLIDTYETKIGPRNGARVVAKAWTDPAFADWLKRDATAAIASLGYTGRQGEHMVAVPNTPDTHNMVVCTLCSCYPWPVLGLPPVWYKSAPYRARAIREPRKVLEEFGVTRTKGEFETVPVRK